MVINIHFFIVFFFNFLGTENANSGRMYTYYRILRTVIFIFPNFSFCPETVGRGAKRKIRENKNLLSLIFGNKNISSRMLRLHHHWYHHWHLMSNFLIWHIFCPRNFHISWGQKTLIREEFILNLNIKLERNFSIIESPKKEIKSDLKEKTRKKWNL